VESGLERHGELKARGEGGDNLEASSALEDAPPGVSASVHPAEPLQTAERTNWLLPIVFLGSVLAMYAVIAYAIYVLIA
jgi:hypothetical protein